jgi:hypothetical protein
MLLGEVSYIMTGVLHKLTGKGYVEAKVARKDCTRPSERRLVSTLKRQQTNSERNEGFLF